MLETAQLPNNVNSHGTDFTCELCGIEPKTKNKYWDFTFYDKIKILSLHHFNS